MDDDIQGRPAASVRRRIAAHAIDAFLLVVGGSVLMVIAAELLGPSVAVRTDASNSMVLVFDPAGFLTRSAILTAGGGAYFTLSWAAPWRATLGQRILGMSVVGSRDRAELGVARAALRWLVMGAPIGLIAAAAVESPLWWLLATSVSLAWTLALLVSTWRSSSNRGLHDRLAGSMVLR